MGGANHSVWGASVIEVGVRTDSLGIPHQNRMATSSPTPSPPTRPDDKDRKSAFGRGRIALEFEPGLIAIGAVDLSLISPPGISLMSPLLARQATNF